ncbi:MAG: VCBS repeat-containing protein [Verrucomicrobiota bacterium]
MNRKRQLDIWRLGLLALALAGWPFDSAQGRPSSVSRGANPESATTAANWDWHTIGSAGAWSSGTTYMVFSSFGAGYPFGLTANAQFANYSGFLYPADRPFGTKNDFDGDRNADVAVYSQADGAWEVWFSGSDYSSVRVNGWGGINFVPVAADYDGDLKTDPAVYNTVSGDWYLFMSGSGYTPPVRVEAFGGGNWLAAPADYDGDQRTDLGIYEPASGTLKVSLSHSGFTGDFANNLGGARFVPVPADYDGDRIDDPAVFEARKGVWNVLLSKIGYASVSESGLGGLALGAPAYMAPVADYDGDGNADPAVYQGQSGNWYVWLSDSGYIRAMAEGCGDSTWTPVPADYDGDGKADLAVYRQDTGHWMFWLSSYGYTPRIDVSGWGGRAFAPVQAH